MINDENLNKLCDGVINGDELTTKNLNNYGFNSKDLTDLIQQEYLERIKRGHYSLASVEDLFYYGKKLMAEKEYDKATECFKKCFELNPNHHGVCLRLFLESINKKDYVSAFKYLDVISNVDTADGDFYLYLLSMIIDIPDKYKEYTRYLKLEDIKVDFNDERYNDIFQQNKIRNFILQRRFPYALKQLNKLIAQHKTKSIQDIITVTLLHQAIDIENISRNNLVKFAENKKYEEIIKYLQEKNRRHDLSLVDSYTLKLANQIKNLQNTHQLPQKTIFRSENLFEAIDGNNYDLALNLSEKYNIKNGIDNSANIMYLLLSEICNMIKENSPESKPSTNIIEDSKENKQIDNNFSTTSSFSDVIGCLMNSDLEKAFISLRNYMKSIGKQDYEFLIVDLIKLSLIEKDVAFTKPMLALTYVSRENFKFDISNYIQEFYIALSQNKFDEARVYLDIISKSKKIGQEYILADNLLQVLNNTEGMVQDKRNNSILEKVEQTFKNSQNIAPKQNNNSEHKLTKNKIDQKQMATDDDKKFIDSKHKLLLNGQGMILLKPMDRERRKHIHQIVHKYHDTVSFSVGEGNNRRIVLRYRPYIDGHVDIKNLIIRGSSYYKEQNYDDCIANYLQLLQLRQPKVFVYAYLGLAYMRKGDKNTAIDYFIVATELSKKQHERFDFTELIASLQGLIADEDKKPRFRMKEKDFYNDIQNYYGIKNFDEIASYILESGLDVETACHELNICDEQIDIIILIYAREFYAHGKYEKGDQFLKSVEQNKNKTKFISNLCEEIRKNKLFYFNRVNENDKSVVLTLQPKKKK